MTGKRKYNAEDGYNLHYRWSNLDTLSYKDAPCVVIRFYPEAVDRFVVEVENPPLFMQPFSRTPCFTLPEALRIQEAIKEQIDTALDKHRRDTWAAEHGITAVTA